MSRNSYSQSVTAQRDHWHCLNCGGSMVETVTIETEAFGTYDQEKCATCGAVVR